MCRPPSPGQKLGRRESLVAVRPIPVVVSLQYCCTGGQCHRQNDHTRVHLACSQNAQERRAATFPGVASVLQASRRLAGTTATGCAKINAYRCTTQRTIEPTLLLCYCCPNCNVQHGACLRVHRFSAPVAAPRPLLRCGRCCVIRVCCSTAAASVPSVPQ